MRYWPLILVALAAPGSAAAEELLRSDFQQGVADPWRAAGAGDVRLTSFEGNVSMRLTAGASALAAVPVEGRRRLYVNAKIAADALDDTAACVAEASRDDGATWTQILSVGKARADAVTLWPGGQALADGGEGLGGGLLLRLSAQGKRATCWFDDVVVTGVARAETSDARQALGRDALFAGAGFDRPVDLSAFAPTADAAPPQANFTGRLHLAGAAMAGFRLIAEERGYERGDTIRSLPDLDLDLVQHGDALIPAQRGLIASNHPDWNWIVEPGRVWSEPGDGGLARAALPFALQERNANCTHNGMLTFLFGADGTVSKAAFEIASETCRYRKFDAWGFVAARAAPGAVADAEAIVRRHEAVVAARLPVRPVEALPDALALATAAGPEPTVYGAVVDGIHYRSACVTRHGDYPACEVIDLPSYSTAKSLFGGVALMRLEKLYPGSAGASIAAYVPACARGWAGVTLEQALDMTTGRYRSAAYMADEDDPSIAGFFEPAGHAAKIAFACTHYPRKAPPGGKWVYHTSDTYLLGTAMAAILREKRGAEADLYDDLVRPMWDGLALSPTLSTTRRSEDAAAQPFVGWGLTFQPDDIARLSRWLMQGAGGLLDQRLLDAAMQRAPAGGGLPAGFPGFRYRAGFWTRDMGARLGCAGSLWVPAMSGFGGISVAMLPGHDALFYSFGDSDHWDWGPAAVALTGKDAPCG
ncbi:MAG: hypothetical protein WA910_04965 [Sphingopyxis granuli]